MDDGTICRLDDDSFYVTTTSSGAGAIYDWFTWWLADWRLDVHLTDVTQGLSAVNLAGPRAREIMGKVTELDCSAEGFTYLDGKQAEVAGVPCLILRIGFVGEVGYEIHCPSAQGEHLWDALMEAGREFGVKPFGLEPQRLLRLQKMHILVGQDTDSESTPFGAAMPWIVKLDKEQDLIGKWALQHYENEQLETTLVGFTLVERARADGGRGRDAGERRADGPGHERALLAAARPGDRDGVGAGGAGEGRRADHDLRREQADRGRGPDEALLRPRRGDPALVSALRPVPLTRPGRGRQEPDGAGHGGRGRDDRAARRLERGHRVPRRGALLCALVGFADVSHLGKLEIQGDVAAITGHDLELGRALRAEGAWWCPYSAQRAVVLCSPNRHRGAPRPPPRVRRGRQRPGERNRHHDLAGSDDHSRSRSRARPSPASRRSTCARQITPVHAFRPGSVARTGGAILCEAPDRYLMLFGAALGQYVWTLVADAAEHLGGGPVGVDRPPWSRSMLDIFRRRRMWRTRPDLKDSYDVVIIGGGSHGLATAYYLAPSTTASTNVAVLEKSYIGSGAAGRNTTILRSNYKTPEGARFYDASVKLYEGLSKELNFNLLFSQNGHLTLAHSDRAMFVMANRAEVNRLHNIDSRLIYPDEIKKLAPAMQVDNPDAV